MPLRTVNIDVSGLPTEIAVAQLFSYIAYPSALFERQQFVNSLLRMALLWRANADKKWGASLQPIPPGIFLEKEKSFQSNLADGMEDFGRHLLTATMFLAPHLMGLEKGKPAPLDTLFPSIDGIEDIPHPSVENTATALARAIGYNEVTSLSTLKSTIWAPVKPISHLGYAIGQWILARGEISADIEIQDNKFFEFFFDKDTVPVCIAQAERHRKELPLVKNAFRIPEENTIQFIAV